LASELVSHWFNGVFYNLSPELQELHRHGGVLQGEVEVKTGNGLAGLIGRRLARKLNIPESGVNKLMVTISHDNHYLHWNRCFNDSAIMESRFKPVGTIADGYWLEKTGPFEMMLTVDVKNQGWYWRCIRFKYRGLPVPYWVFPKMNAYKKSEDGGYRFYVGFSAPLLGLLFSYSGILAVTR